MPSILDVNLLDEVIKVNSFWLSSIVCWHRTMGTRVLDFMSYIFLLLRLFFFLFEMVENVRN